jgi:hypothetical protein
MDPTTGFIISFAVIAFGGVGLACFAIWHRQRDGDDDVSPSRKRLK